MKFYESEMWFKITKTHLHKQIIYYRELEAITDAKGFQRQKLLRREAEHIKKDTQKKKEKRNDDAHTNMEGWMHGRWWIWKKQNVLN